MAKSFFEWLEGKIRKRDGSDVEYITIVDRAQDLAMQKLAYEICVQRIAKAIAKCEFRTYENHLEVKSHAYYMLNVRPNPNQSGTEFWQAFVEKLYHDQEVLMIESKGQLYIADSFDRDDEQVTKPQIFSKVKIGKLTFNKSFSMEDVAYIRLSNQKVKRLLDQTMSAYGDLMNAATKAYKSGVGMKAKLHLDRQRQEMDDRAQKALQKSISSFLNDPNACFYEYEGMSFDPFDTSRKGTQQSSRDIKAMMDDVLEITSKAFLIPSNIVTGEVTDTSKAVDDFLTFCLDSVIALIEDGLNHALYKEEGFLNGDHIKINAQSIKHIDILDASGSIDKLISCGAKSVNDILKITGDEPLPYDWADKHWITKNYSPIDELNELGKGGETNEKNRNGKSEGEGQPIDAVSDENRSDD